MNGRDAAALTGRVRDILRNEWDPVGVNSGEETAPGDEYESFALPIAGMLARGAERSEVAARLGRFTRDDMGLGAMAGHNARIARKLLSLVKEEN